MPEATSRDSCATTGTAATGVRKAVGMTTTQALHTASAAAHRSTAEAYEAAARVLQLRDPSASLRHTAKAAAHRCGVAPTPA